MIEWLESNLEEGQQDETVAEVIQASPPQEHLNNLSNTRTA